MKLIVTGSYEESSRIAADMFEEVIINKKNPLLGCATGSTPIGLYQCLTEDYRAGKIDFSGVRTINLDEYAGLTKSHSQSFGYFMEQHLFSKVNIKKENIMLIDGAAQAEDQCRDYDRFLEQNEIDILVLGIGNNGHIGFNEPTDNFPATVHTVQLTESTINANSRLFERREDVPTQAITMGIGTIMKAKKILLIAGPDKAEIVEKACFGKVTPEVPASVLQLHPDVTVILSAEK